MILELLKLIKKWKKFLNKEGMISMQTALIFNIQKFSLHDGPGIRTTVFFKGCPLNCLWCHNPESQSYSKQFIYNREKCSECGQCKKVCPEKECICCGRCLDVCPNNAREIAGDSYTVNQLLKEIEKDRPFYEQTKGGVTFSGGEAMTQINFLEEIITACKNSGISVVIDTCGYVPWGNFLRILDKTDLFLYDLKLMDPLLHKKYTGQDNQLILENLKELSRRGAKINLRLPLIEGINTKDDQLKEIIQFINGLKIAEVSLLPYHDLGRSKYEKLGIEGEMFLSPSLERLEEIKSMFAKAGFRVSIGG